jgi:hypothetical protein
MTRRIGRIELAPMPLPAFRNHAEWCNWLWTRGILSVNHRGCRVSDHCVATEHRVAEESWRYRRADAPVSR